MTEKRAALLVVAIIAATTIFGVLGRPGVDKAMNNQIKRENTAVCTRFGFAGTDRFTGCLAELADLRRRHSDMLAFYSWP